ncbi:MAG: hypothetical protein CL681_19310 [Blastopirellula sp.]|nr:hypothetical protein [Blastopirellula sp.]
MFVIRKWYLWPALAAFTLLNVGGEALHHANLFGFHSQHTVSACDCAHHHSDASASQRNGVQGAIEQCDHTCTLCQYYSQAKPDVQEDGSDGNLLPPSPEQLAHWFSVPATMRVHNSSARGPPLA